MNPNLPWPRPKNWSSLWPALKGSLSKINKPCIRPGCPVCAAGTKHPAYILSFTKNGKRKCMYVPLGMVDLLQEALNNGRKIEDLLYEQGPLILKLYRKSKMTPTYQKKAKKRKKPPEPGPNS